MAEVYIGIDASLVGTGLIALNHEAKILSQKKISSSSKARIEARITTITNDILDFIFDNQGTHINLEGVFVGRNPKKALQSGGLHYHLRIMLEENSIIPTVTPPTQLKKFVTKKGTCKKDMMLLKTFRRWGVEFEDHDLCDAYGLARMLFEERKDKKVYSEKPKGFIRRVPLHS